MFGPLGVALLYAFPSGVSVRVCSRVSRVDASGRARGMEQMASLCSTLQKALPATPLPATPPAPPLCVPTGIARTFHFPISAPAGVGFDSWMTSVLIATET